MRSATWEGLANESGYPLPELLTLIEKLATGGVGLIVPGFVYPIKSGRAAPSQGGLHNDSTAQAWESSIARIHKTSSKIIFQVGHVGPKGSLSGDLPLAPSAISGKTREISVSEIESLVEAFAKTAKRAQTIGADGIQLHAAHGFLLSSFLTPSLNQRTDAYGKDRTLLISQIATEVRRAVGPNFLIAAKINGNDYYPGGVVPSLAAEYVSKLTKVIDLFETSAQVDQRPYSGRINFKPELYRKMLPKELAEPMIQGLQELVKDVPYFEAFNLDSAKAIRARNPSANLAVVGGLLTFDTMEKIVKDGVGQLVSLSRPFLRQPNLVRLFEKGLEKAECIHCGLCFAPPLPPACRYPPVK
jgi:2,4-dienoyl-CoA reductase-like NADH-dependent reductase (Old Yellow Enzyme family)